MTMSSPKAGVSAPRLCKHVCAVWMFPWVPRLAVGLGFRDFHSCTFVHGSVTNQRLISRSTIPSKQQATFPAFAVVTATWPNRVQTPPRFSLRCNQHQTFASSSRKIPKQSSLLPKNDEQIEKGTVTPIMTQLTRRTRTWKRLQHALDLAMSTNTSENGNKKQWVADLGCDHGLLPLALAMHASSPFQTIMGVDSSEQALKQGALTNLEYLLCHVQNDKQFDMEWKARLDCKSDAPWYWDATVAERNVTFVKGDGLLGLVALQQQNDTMFNMENAVGTVCLCGMGVHTMRSILLQKHEEPAQPQPQPTKMKSLDSTDPPTKVPQDQSTEIPPPSPYLLHTQLSSCQRIIVQPTNTKPKHLKHLYKGLWQVGFRAVEEFMVLLRRRYYITTLFERVEQKGREDVKGRDDVKRREEVAEMVPLGACLMSRFPKETHPMRQVYASYLQHHQVWREKDEAVREKYGSD